MLLKGKKALITGCNKGIGKSIFEKFIENEGEIIACVRNKSNEFEEFVNSKKKDHSIFIYEIDFSDQNCQQWCWLSQESSFHSFSPAQTIF